MFQIQLNQERLRSHVIIKEILLTLLMFNIVTTLVIIVGPSVLAITTMPGNHTGNMTFVGNMTGGKSMMMPGGNMTFGASLHNAKMHLMEAIMDLKIGNTKGAMMELNLTGQGIKMHEQEIKGMMMEVKSIMAHER